MYDDGSAEIVEGNRATIAPLLRFLRTPVDELQDIKKLIEGQAAEISHVSQKIDRNMSYILDSLYPIPDVRDMKLEDAVKRLEECGLAPNIIQSDGISDDKQVVSFVQRNKTNFKYVDVGTTLIVPAVDGLTKDVAIEVLKKAGFEVEVKSVPAQEQEQDIVLRYRRNDDAVATVEIEVGSLKPEDDRLVRFFNSVESATRYQMIARQWNGLGLGEDPLYSEIDKIIKSKSETERMYGPTHSPQAIKDFIEELRAKCGKPEEIKIGINASGKKAVYPISTEEPSTVKCPKCMSLQPKDRHVCWKCGVPFMY